MSSGLLRSLGGGSACQREMRINTEGVDEPLRDDVEEGGIGYPRVTDLRGGMNARRSIFPQGRALDWHLRSTDGWLGEDGLELPPL